MSLREPLGLLFVCSTAPLLSSQRAVVSGESGNEDDAIGLGARGGLGARREERRSRNRAPPPLFLVRMRLGVFFVHWRASRVTKKNDAKTSGG